jgi:hypothetical protein
MRFGRALQMPFQNRSFMRSVKRMTGESSGAEDAPVPAFSAPTAAPREMMHAIIKHQ